MDKYTIDEIQYKNGYRKGYEDGKKDAVKHGRWEKPYINAYGNPCHCCSECGFKASHKDKHYCPNCGARMDGAEDGN